MSGPPSTAAIRTDLARLQAAAAGASDASAFRTAVRNICAACRSSQLALAAYCREGVLPQLAAAMPQVIGNAPMGVCTLEAALCLAQKLLDAKGDAGAYAVGESVMARRVDGDFGEGIVLDTLDDGSHLIVWSEEDTAAKISGAELMPFGSGIGLATERRQRVAPAFILNNFLLKTAIPSNDISRVQMVVRDGADVNCTDADGNSPLVLAASNAASVAMVQFLISRGAHVNYSSAAGSALGIAAAQDNTEVVRCLLAHGADAGVVDLSACAEESAALLREVLSDAAASDAKAGGSPGAAPLWPAERDSFASDAFRQLAPALVATLGSAHSPKLHKRVLMVLAYLVRRASAPRLAALSPLQLGALLGALRVLLASPALLEQFAALRMLTALLEAAPAVGATARRHGLEPVLARLAEATADIETAPAHGGAAAGGGGGSGASSPPAPAPAAASGGAASAAAATAPPPAPQAAAPHHHSRSVGLRAADVAALAAAALTLLRAAPAAADEAAPCAALVKLQSSQPFGAAMRELAGLLVGRQAPSAHELQQSGALRWLLGALTEGPPAELRARWAAFEAADAFGPPWLPRGEGALAQLLQLLHNGLVAAEVLPVLSYSSAGEAAHALKPLGESLHVVLHPLHPASAAAAAAEAEGGPAPPLQYSIDPLVRVAELQALLLRTTAPDDTTYDAFCERLVGCVIEERPLPRGDAAATAAAGGAGGGGGGLPFRRATVTGLRVGTPLRLPLHTLEYDPPAGGAAGSRPAACEVVMASREYRIVGRVSKERLAEARSRAAAGGSRGAVADPDARIHSVTISCPEGLPVDFFLSEVLPEVRRALRQAEPGCAPMTRSVNDDYGWRDRGWERGGAQFERGLGEKLRDTGSAAVARRQTKREAETLVTRLKDTLMVAVEVDNESSNGGGDGEPPAAERFPLLSRVQGLVAFGGGGGGAGAGGGAGGAAGGDEGGSGGAQWLPATVAEAAGGGLSLVFDDGSFEAAVPGYRVRAVPQEEASKRLNPLAAIFMTFEQFLSSREERRADPELGGRESAPANLRRTLSAFHVGRAGQVGHVPMDGGAAAAAGSAPEAMETDDDDAAAGGGGEEAAAEGARAEVGAVAGIAPMRLRVRFSLGLPDGTAPPEGAPVEAFGEGTTLLHCLQRLRETSPLRAQLTPRELGYHPGVTCDRTGMSPILGDRYKLDGENYDVCEAEYLKMDAAERATYTRIAPPCFRKPRGSGPPVWHLWYKVEVPRTAAASSSPGPSASHPLPAASAAASDDSAAAAAASPPLPWSASDAEAGILAGQLSADAVLRELRRASASAPAREAALSPPTLALLRAPERVAPAAAAVMEAFREVSGARRAARQVASPLPSAASLSALASDLSRCGATDGAFTDALLALCLLAQRLLPSAPDHTPPAAAAGASPAAALAAAAAAASSSAASAGASSAPGAPPAFARSSSSMGGACDGEGAPSSADTLRRQLVSPRLSSKLQQQLGDALAVTAGALPGWCEVLLRRCPDLFSPGSRARYFHATSFGVSRALHWSQEQGVAAVRAAYAEELAALDRARLEAEVSSDAQALAEVVEQVAEVEDRIGRDRMGALRSDIARVSRDALLPSAERLMGLHAGCASALEVQFEGESGFGSGVTQNFYSAVANELLKAKHQAELPLWLAEHAGIDPEGFISHPGSLFPRPLPPEAPPAVREAVRGRFRFLGRLAAKACRDDFIVPLPLSLDFLHLVRGGSLTYDALPPAGATGGVASAYAAVACELAAADAAAGYDDPAARRSAAAAAAAAEFAVARMGLGAPMSLADWLAATGATFACPLTGAPLCAGGEEIEVTAESLREFVHLLAQLWLADGVAEQASGPFSPLAFTACRRSPLSPRSARLCPDASPNLPRPAGGRLSRGLRRGVSAQPARVPPLPRRAPRPASPRPTSRCACRRLAPFTLAELRATLCGTGSIEWTEAELSRHILPAGGYTKHSKVYQLLIDELQAMAHAERRAFLNFVTACPHLPPVGLASLEIEVLPQHNGAKLPTAQTCGNKLYLPEYTDAASLREGLGEAFANAEFGGLHERA